MRLSGLLVAREISNSITVKENLILIPSKIQDWNEFWKVNDCFFNCERCPCQGNVREHDEVFGSRSGGRTGTPSTPVDRFPLSASARRVVPVRRRHKILRIIAGKKGLIELLGNHGNTLADSYKLTHHYISLTQGGLSGGIEADSSRRELAVRKTNQREFGDITHLASDGTQ